MKKIILGLAGALLIAAGVWAQVTLPQPSSMGVSDRVQVIPGGQPSAGSVYATLTQLRAWVLGGASGHSGTPVLTSCGTGSPTISGTDTSGTITVGTSATGCVATFATAFVSAPTCVATSRTAPATTTPAYTVSTTALTLTQTSTSGNLWDYVCIAKAGG